MAKYFSYYEFVKSDTAKRLRIDNDPDTEDKKNNILELMRVMDVIRERWTEYCEENCLGDPAIVINSGYRSHALNYALKGSKTSAHRVGSACDFEARNGQNKALFGVCREVLEDIPFDQLINERNYSWIHLGIRNLKGEQRREIKDL